MSSTVLSLVELEDQALELTQEAINFRGAMRHIGDKLNAYSESFQTFVKEQFIEEEPQIGLINESVSKKVASNANYMTLRRRNVVVPPGLSVSYLDHIGTLSHIQDTVDTVLSDVLIPIEYYLGSLLSRPDTLLSHREPTVVQDVVDRDLDSLKERLAKDFDKSKHETASYGDLVGRQSDWTKISTSFNDLSDRLNKIDRQKVLDHVTRIGEYIERLIEHLEDDSQAYAQNGISISNLAKVTYAVASDVEFYATQAYMVELLQTSIENAIEVANKG